ncbi:tetratricopeptide repeat protein [Azotobacter sp. CWF10]
MAARFQAMLSAKHQEPGDGARAAGFDALQGRRNAAALQSFRLALNHNPRDAEAWGGLGIAQLRAQNYRDAATSLLRATELAPGSRDRWAKALADAEFYGKLQTARQSATTATWTALRRWPGRSPTAAGNAHGPPSCCWPTSRCASSATPRPNNSTATWSRRSETTGRPWPASTTACCARASGRLPANCWAAIPA